MKPILKWVGGKSQIIDEVLAAFPDVIENDYYEPFLGGGSVLLGLLSSHRIRVRGCIYASDINAHLISCYVNIQSRPEDVIAELRKIHAHVNIARSAGANVRIIRNPHSLEEAQTSPEAYYYWMRFQYNSLDAEQKNSPLGAAMMIYLNKTCFRGLYREGPHGFNVPYGNYKNPSIDEAHIMAVSRLIQNVVFSCRSFADTLCNVRDRDFVYLDPPYAPETTTSFVQYTKVGFSKENHAQLFELCKTIALQRHARFVMSNASVQLVHEAFPEPDFSTKIISCRRAINSKDPSSRTNEVLISSR